MNGDEVKQVLQAKGYTLDKIVEFKTSDRIRFHNKDLNININLGKKVEDLTVEEFSRWVL